MIIFDGREDGRVQVRCMAGCEPQDIIAVLKSRGLWHDDYDRTSQERLQQEQDEAKKREHKLRVYARAIFDDAKPIRATIAETYFESRDLHTVVRMIEDIRYHHSCPRGDKRQPAVIVAMRSIDTNAVTGIQRIFLTPAGRKDGKGMMLGTCGGAAMKLQKLQNHSLHICEGLETGLAILAMDHGPVWALGSTSNMQSFPVIDSVSRLTIWADNDPAGIKAAEACSNRWARGGKTVEQKKPRQAGWDADNVWRARNGAQ